MKISLKPQHLRRYKEIARLLYRHVNTGMVEHFGLEQALADNEDIPTSKSSPKPEELASDLEGDGPNLHQVGAGAFHPP